MIGLLSFVVAVLASPIKAKIRLEDENAALRHQLVVLRRQLKGRARLTNDDRWFFVQLYRWFPSILPALMIIRPETLVRWHRAGFRRYWRWQSRRRGGQPPIEAELRALIRQISTETLLWGAPRVHGELLKLGIDIGQTSVAKYTVRGEPAGYATPADPAFISFRSPSTSDTGSGYRHLHLRYKSAGAVEAGRNHDRGLENVHPGPSRGDLGRHDPGPDLHQYRRPSFSRSWIAITVAAFAAISI